MFACCYGDAPAKGTRLCGRGRGERGELHYLLPFSLFLSFSESFNARAREKPTDVAQRTLCTVVHFCCRHCMHVHAS